MSSVKLPPAKKQKKEAQVKDLDKAKEIIAKYLEENLRPYSVNDVYLNLHGCISKTLVTKVLTALSEENKLVQKTYGKMNFYVFKISETSLRIIENPCITLEAVSGLEKEQNELVNRLATLQTELKKLKQFKSTEEYADFKQNITSDISSMKTEINRLKENAKGFTINHNDLTSLQCKIKLVEKESKNRKKDYESIVCLLRENMSNYKVILEEAGIEEIH